MNCNGYANARDLAEDRDREFDSALTSVRQYVQKIVPQACSEFVASSRKSMSDQKTALSTNSLGNSFAWLAGSCRRATQRGSARTWNDVADLCAGRRKACAG
jgi:hypothetical protein